MQYYQIKYLKIKGGEWGWRWEKACNAGGILVRSKYKTLMIKCQNSLGTIQVTPLTTTQVLAIRADLKECFVEHSGLRLGKSERIFYAPLFQSKTFIDHLVQRALRVNRGPHAEISIVSSNTTDSDWANRSVYFALRFLSGTPHRNRQTQTGQIGA